VISKKILPACVVYGFTYEAEAIQGWLDGGNDNSPMTNDKLDPHNIVPIMLFVLQSMTGFKTTYLVLFSHFN